MAIIGKSGYEQINGLEMYYEIRGSGSPLVFLPPAFGYGGQTDLSWLESKRSVLTPELQGWGRTRDIDRTWSFEQSADDIAALMDRIGIDNADFFGVSYGGLIGTLIALRHPGKVRRIATYGATFGPPAACIRSEMLASAGNFTADCAAIRFLREGHERLSPEPGHWAVIWEKVSSVQWNGFSSQELESIEVPLLIAVGDHDFVKLEHSMEVFRQIPQAQLAVIPSASHFVTFEEPEVVLPLVLRFLEAPESALPFSTLGTGYYPGETR